MKSKIFFRIGEAIYQFRWLIIVLWTAAIFACIPFLPHIASPFQSTGFVVNGSESATTEQYLNKHLGYNKNRFIVIYHSQDLVATDAAFIHKMKTSLQGLKRFPMKHEVILPDANAKQISKDKHTAYAVILFKDNTVLGPVLLKKLKSEIKKPAGMSIQLGGEAVFIENVNQQTQVDLYRADAVAAPASVITLVLIFGTLVAALVPIVLGGGCALIILTLLYFLGHAFSLSVFTLNIALLLGLCLSLDYSLFMIYRFRDELRQTQHSIIDKIAVTLATAGRAVFFSGLAVFISLSALLFFPINILFSIGVGGLVAVFVAVAIATTLLPATLAVLQDGINCLSLRRHRVSDTKKTKSKIWHLWRDMAKIVIKYPRSFFFSTLIVLLCCGYPFTQVHLGLSGLQTLPSHTDGYRFLKTYQTQFNENELTPILLVVKSAHTPILSKANVGRLYSFAQRLKDYPLVEEVSSIVSIKTNLKKSQYQAMYHLPKQQLPADIRQLLKTSTAKYFTVMTVVSKYGSNSPKTLELISQLRKLDPGKGLTVTLTGEPVNNADVLHSIAHMFPYAVAWVMILTYCILLVLLRSLFLPFKAILMNILSLCASYGVLVFVFQEGHFHHYLNFNIQGMLDMTLLIIIFCALFGFSMDYEVFLLTRIKECYDTTQDNDKSIIFGIEKSCKIITSAAIIVIILCGSFMSADVLMVKEFGLGIAIAIFVDAFIIRSLLVPATMVLVKRWNWYLPWWLNRLLP